MLRTYGFFIIFITILLVTLIEFGFILSIIKPVSINQYFSLPKNSNLLRILFGFEIVVLFIILSVLLMGLSKPHPDPKLVASSLRQSSMTVKLEGMIQLEHDSYPTQENYYFLYEKTDKSKDALGKDAQYIKDNFCKIACTINFFDDKHAFTIDHERATITSTPIMQQWNMNNYVFVADHYLGYLPNAKYATFAYFPYKDLYYQKLKKK